MAALVTTVEDERTVLQLVNLNPFEQRTLVMQAGGFGEHRFVSATFDLLTSDYPGSQKRYDAPPVECENKTVEVADTLLKIELPPATQITLDLSMQRYVNMPSYRDCWTGTANLE